MPGPEPNGKTVLAKRPRAGHVRPLQGDALLKGNLRMIALFQCCQIRNFVLPNAENRAIIHTSTLDIHEGLHIFAGVGSINV
jgi:hypothetical protein